MRSTTAPPIFREAALRHLALPEDMDHLLTVASPGNWFLVAAGVLGLTCVAIWSWAGSVTRTATGQGMLIAAGGIVSIDAPGAGRVVSLAVKAGDTVRANQVVARIGNPLLAEQVRVTELALQEGRQE